MPDRPYVLLSCAISLDGCLDDASSDRLVLSDTADLDRVDEERAGVDAILVGGNTIRRDDPRLMIRSADRSQDRLDHGRAAHPIKVAITATGDLSPKARFFTDGDTGKLVYAPPPVAAGLRRTLDGRAEVIAAEPWPGSLADVLPGVLDDLAGRGVRRLMVEGGGRVLTAFLTAGLADELQVVVAPFFVGDRDAPRFALPGTYPYDPERPMRLRGVRRMGDLVLLDYLAGDQAWLHRTVELSRNCPPSDTAFSVGAVIVDADGNEIATGYSRESDPHDHAEEAALAKLAADDPRLPGATIYSSLEPCTSRVSRPRTCTELILESGIPRVVFAWREPSIFVDCVGAETLRAAGRTVIELPELADEVRTVNAHLLGN